MFYREKKRRKQLNEHGYEFPTLKNIVNSLNYFTLYTCNIVVDGSHIIIENI